MSSIAKSGISKQALRELVREEVVRALGPDVRKSKYFGELVNKGVQDVLGDNGLKAEIQRLSGGGHKASRISLLQ